MVSYTIYQIYAQLYFRHVNVNKFYLEHYVNLRFYANLKSYFDTGPD